MNGFKYRVGDIIKFTDSVEETESGFESGMIAKISKIKDKPDNIVEVYFDFSEYEEHNIGLMPPAFFDDAGKPTLKWNQTEFYPNNKIESVFIYADDPPFKLYFPDTESKTPPDDINWRSLEDETYRRFPDTEVLIRTNITERFTYCRNIQDGISTAHEEKVLAYAFLNQYKPQ